jgi:hypothetical protein
MAGRTSDLKGVRLTEVRFSRRMTHATQFFDFVLILKIGALCGNAFAGTRASALCGATRALHILLGRRLVRRGE